jgi:hypothetical protein
MSSPQPEAPVAAGKTRLAALEAVIERGMQAFMEVGTALLEIRGKRLYRAQGFKTFEDYCRARWKMSQPHAQRMIDASEVAQNLIPIGITPKNEAQARELAHLPPEQQREVAAILSRVFFVVYLCRIWHKCPGTLPFFPNSLSDFPVPKKCPQFSTCRENHPVFRPRHNTLRAGFTVRAEYTCARWRFRVRCARACVSTGLRFHPLVRNRY